MTRKPASLRERVRAALADDPVYAGTEVRADQRISDFGRKESISHVHSEEGMRSMMQSPPAEQPICVMEVRPSSFSDMLTRK